MSAPLDPACIFGALRDHDVEYVLVGGLAAVLHGSSAMTNDADILPSKEPEQPRSTLRPVCNHSTLGFVPPTVPTASSSTRTRHCWHRWRC